MSDGLLLSRGEKLRRYSTQTGIVAGPSLLLAAVIAGIFGDLVVAAFVATMAGLTALGVGSSLRTRVGAAVLGVLLLGALIGLLLITAWYIKASFIPGF